MAILNYTTTTEASKTVGEVQNILAKAGAKSITVDYDKGRPISVLFSMATPFGDRWFELPAHSDRVRAVLLHQRVKPGLSTVEQAERVAWRITKDWIQAQLAIIQAGMVTLDQIMLPYMKGDNGKTVFESYRDQQLQLEAGTKNV